MLRSGLGELEDLHCCNLPFAEACRQAVASLPMMMAMTMALMMAMTMLITIDDAFLAGRGSLDASKLFGIDN